MAMNKKEKAWIEELKTEIALKFTAFVEKDLDPPTLEESNKIVNGYLYNAYCMTVDKSCSSNIYHNDYGWDKTTSQNPIKQYSTERKAWQGMRNEVEKQCAEKLRKIDKKIEELNQ